MMVNANGTMVSCDNYGMGIFWAIMADNMQDACLEARRDAGFFEMEKAGSAGFSVGENLQIISIISGGPADSAGLLLGDKIEKINDLPVANKKDADFMLFGPAGAYVELSFIRDGRSLSFSVARRSWQHVSQISKVAYQDAAGRRK